MHTTAHSHTGALTHTLAIIHIYTHARTRELYCQSMHSLIYAGCIAARHTHMHYSTSYPGRTKTQNFNFIQFFFKICSFFFNTKTRQRTRKLFLFICLIIEDVSSKSIATFIVTLANIYRFQLAKFCLNAWNKKCTVCMSVYTTNIRCTSMMFHWLYVHAIYDAWHNRNACYSIWAW